MATQKMEDVARELNLSKFLDEYNLHDIEDGIRAVDAVAASFEASEKESLGMTRRRRNCAACGTGSHPWCRTASSVPGWKARQLKG